MSLAVSILGAACPLAVVGLVAFGFYTRRGESAPDVPGVRTLANFRGGESLVLQSERDAAAESTSVAYGEGIAKALAADLSARGLTISEPDADDSGWAFHLELGTDRAYLLVGLVEEWEWVLHVMEPSGGGPCAAAFLPHVDAALKSLPGVTDILWYHRDRFSPGEPSAATEPLAPV